MSRFVHLRVRSEFSLVDSIVRVKALVAQVKEQGMPAVGITDVCNFFGLIKFYKAAQSSGIKPICGADFYVRSEDEEDAPYVMTALAQTPQGYKNIIELISRAYQDGQSLGRPYIRRQWLGELSEGIIVLSGGATRRCG